MTVRRWLGPAVLAYLAGVALLFAVAYAGRAPDAAVAAVPALVALTPTVLLGLLVAWRRPDSPAGPALVGLGAAPALTWALEDWGGTYATAHPLPGSHAGAFLGGGGWVFNFAGFVGLCLVFPNGRLPSRLWRAVPWCFLGAAALVIVVIGLEPTAYQDRGGPLPGSAPLPLGIPAFRVLDVVAGLALLAVLGSAVAALVTRYRSGDDLTRVQLRWLMLGAISVPVLLAAGWAAEFAGAPIEVAYSGFLAAMVLLVPATVAIAILRHDLLDVDRLLNETVSWLVTSIVSAGVFALVVLGVAQVSARADDRVGITAAAFVTALALLPLHRRVHGAAGRLLDRERTVMVASVRRFVGAVRDGRAQPEEVEAALRAGLGDPGLRVLLRLPGADGYVDLAGAPVAVPPEHLLPLAARDADVGALVLGRSTARRRRQARELAVEARLPIEVSRLRVELRQALQDARTSRARLVEAVTEERQRLERDLHDGAQQRILAVGMRLRSVQRTLAADGPIQAELDAAVAALEATVAELRRIAHGMRPSRLDEGLAAAVGDLVRDSPVPVDLRVDGADVSEAAATTAYYVIAECLANALKHAGATRIGVSVRQEATRLHVQVDDDGRGGAVAGFGLTALGDRVAALGGRIEIVSPAGAGTVVRAEV
ncbi:histidine kinase [Dactylosporangium sucinum]|uniref:sensor histidine kinase n=1 Tax=Dactylosporangium sucinum TaxID=1424081 RepID=UPI00167D7E2A|nr:histidine kinase [Dactylosporangium sucinum]